MRLLRESRASFAALHELEPQLPADLPNLALVGPLRQFDRPAVKEVLQALRLVFAPMAVERHPSHPQVIQVGVLRFPPGYLEIALLRQIVPALGLPQLRREAAVEFVLPA